MVAAEAVCLCLKAHVCKEVTTSVNTHNFHRVVHVTKQSVLLSVSALLHGVGQAVSLLSFWISLLGGVDFSLACLFSIYHSRRPWM